jgi:hypothetical protein|tara:strand:- start:681 stop:842 length:162 start_codon:yes stop_codon:yes gene_type:complete
MSWQQLLDIKKRADEDRRIDSTEPPSSCPIDGYKLDVRPDGARNCPMGNYRWG